MDIGKKSGQKSGIFPGFAFTQEDMRMLECKDLCFSYEKGKKAPLALDHIQLQVRRGEWVAVIGANGSGKSTLARHLNGLLLPDQGQVALDGHTTDNGQDLRYIRQQVGLIMQNPDNQIVASTVEEDTAFGLENQGLPGELIRQKVDEVLSWLGLADCSQKAPYFLSGGQKQKLAIAGVLVTEPAYLVADEPTSMLDPKGQKDVMDALRKMHREKKMGIVHITHRLEEAAKAERIVVMQQGKIAMSGAPAEIFGQKEKLLALSLRIPTVMQLSDSLAQEGYPTLKGILNLEELVAELCRLPLRT